ncbi:DNA translocase FtsK [hydrothermal vent metagenome]|uniref:DNA translocase FtsK n=1 Tax=hydrothermal vent metagenome TaxID=652676 RepID=A0A3B0UGE5_9ZZZZ
MKLKYINFLELLFPSELRRAILRHLAALAGIGLLAVALSFGLSLASWTSTDPSFNHATTAQVRNWLGQTGANVADIAMQSFGLGAIALALVLAAWGWRLASGRPLRRPLRRILITGLALALAGGFASGLAAPGGWPLVAGLGGMFGDLVFAAANWPFTELLGFRASTPATLLLAVFALATAWYASAIGTAPEKIYRQRRRRKPSAGGARADEDQPHDSAALIGLGALVHFSFSAFAMLRRFLRWLFTVITGRSRNEEQSRLKIAMARAGGPGSNDLDWRPSGGPAQIHRSDDFGDGQSDPAPRPAQTRAMFGLAALRRLWNSDDGDRTNAGEGRIEPHLSGQDGGWGFAEPGGEANGHEGGDLGFDDEHDAAANVSPEKRAGKKRRKKASSNTGFNFGGDPDTEYQLPPLTLLSKPSPANISATMSNEILTENARMLEGVLEDFGVRGQIINVRPGPVVTLYELEPAPGIKSSRVIGLADDIARSMSAISARVAVVPGRNAIGIELPNERRETVFFYDLLASDEYSKTKQSLPMALGKNIGGEPVVTDLARMPHLLVAGTTGSGKSVGINAMILSLLFHLRPDECKLIMIDPKMLELSVYDGIPHLLSPVVTEPGKAVVALKWAVREMEDRYKKMSKLGVRNIDGFNTRVRDAHAKGEVLTRTVQTGFDRETGQAVYETEEMDLSPLPYIVIFVDEMADLMMVAGKDIEGTIQRLAQMARAAGLHLITATQRPSVDVITGTIKANFPTRISFQVTSKIDSRTILGEMGAEQLLGQGDMLHMAGGGRIGRVHGAFVSDEEVESVVQFLKRQGVPEYLEAVTAETEDSGEDGYDGGIGSGNSGSEADQIYDQAVAIVARDRKASTSYIQRRLSIGYNRAATIIERMEIEGAISAANHAGKREVLLPEPSYEDG